MKVLLRKANLLPPAHRALRGGLSGRLSAGRSSASSSRSTASSTTRTDGPFERDRKRDAARVLAGYRVIRITWRQPNDEPLMVAATIASALSASRSAG